MKRIEGMSQQYKETGAQIGSGGRPSLLFAPYYMIAFVSMPFLWQARTPVQLVSAVESILYQYFLFVVILNWRAVLSATMLPQKFSWIIYFVLTSIVYGMATSNFGLGVREKCMVLPVLILFFAVVTTMKAGKKRERRFAAALRARAARIAWFPRRNPAQ